MNDQRGQSEKKLATVLVAGVSGLDGPAGEQVGLGVTGILSKCMDMMEPVVELYGGTIERFQGERMIAFFGLPEGKDHFQAEAANMALELKNRLERMIADKELPEGIGLRIGISTGEVIAGVIGTGKNQHYTVLGAAVELASRIHDLAESNQTIIDGETAKHLSDRFVLRDMESAYIKGFKHPVQISELLGRKKQSYPEAAEPVRMISSDLIGRKKELDLLEKQIMELIVEGRGGVINLMGEPGIGKSRLIAEFMKNEAIANVGFFEGRAMSFGSNLSYHPLSQVIRSWAGICEDDPTLHALEKLESSIKRVYPDGAGEVFPFIATMMGYPLSGSYLERVKGICSGSHQSSAGTSITRCLKKLQIPSVNWIKPWNTSRNFSFSMKTGKVMRLNTCLSMHWPSRQRMNPSCRKRGRRCT